MFVVRYGAKGVIVPYENLTPNPGKLMVRHGIQYFSGYTDVRQKFLWVEGKLENGNEGCMLQLTPFHKIAVCTAV